MKTSYVPVRLLGAACALVMALGTILNGGAAPPQEPAPHALETLGFRPEAASAGKPGFDVLRWRSGFADLAAIEFREVQPGTDLVLRGSGSAMEALIALAPTTTPSSLVLAVPAGLRMGVDGAAEGVHDGTPVRVMATFYQTRGADLVRVAGGLLLSSDQLTFWAERTEKRAPLVVSLRVTFGAAAPIDSAVQSFGPGAATLTATLQTDADSNSQVTPGDTLRYRLTIPNAGAAIPNVVATIPLSVYHTSVPGTLNVSPFALDLADTTAEDVPLPLVLAGTDAEGQVLTYTIVTPPAHGVLVPASPGSANQTYTPEANYHGPDSFTYEVNDGRLDSNEVGTVTLTVTPRNDAPSFTKGADVTVVENSGAYSQTGWATAISAGGPDEAGQTLTFNVTGNTNAALFNVAPAVASNGTLTFTPATDANGSATITLTLSDDGGTANGGADTSAAQTFLITVSGVNAAPSFTKGADQTVLEDAGAQTVPGWATAIDPGAGESGQTLTFQITNNTNAALFSSGPAVSGTTGDLIYTPAANANGTATITLRLMDNGGTANGGVDASPTQTFVINVTTVNDAPGFTKGADVTVLENSGAFSQTGWATAIGAGPANESAQTLTFVVTNNTNAALFSAGPAVASNGDLTFTPAADASGAATITLRLDDNGGTADGGVNQSATQTFLITVSGINSAPSFTKGADQTVTEDAGAQTASGWATAIDPGVGETGQVLTFEITNNTNAALFSAGPAVSGTTGDLTYTPAVNANGTATITLRLTDDGGTDNGGVDASPTQTFAINVTTVNDAPSFTKGTDETVLEDSGPQTVPGWATAISAGPSDESAQTLTFTVTNNTNAALFSAAPAVSATTGNLTYTPAGNANGTATITLRLDDNGGVLNGGVNQSPTQTFIINVTNINDAPSFTPGANQTVNEDAGAQSVSSFITAISAGPSEGSQTLTLNIVSNTNGALFSALPAIASNGTLTYTPAANTSGTATITYNLQDNGGTANGGVDITGNQSFTITVNSVNDAPSFTKGADQTVLEDSGVQTVPGWATAISAGPSDESAQVLTFTVTNNTNAALFSAGPAVNATNGNLTYTPAANAFGTATITLRLDDDGGVLNGGVNQSATQTFVINVTNVNDVPSFTPGANQTVNEDAGAQSVSSFATAISAGPNEGSQTLTFNIVSNTNSALFSAGPAIASNGTLTYTSAANASGAATITYNLQDNGGTANSGVDITGNQSFTITVNPVNDPPTVGNKSATAHTNMPISFNAANGLLNGATDPDDGLNGCSTTLSVVNISATSPAGGSAVLDNADGSFTFSPPPGVTGPVTFTYQVQDNGCPGTATSAAATVTVTVSGPTIWFVDDSIAGGNGTLGAPFQTLAQADAVDAASHRVFVYSGTYATGLTLNASEWLIGQAATGASFDALMSISPPAGTMARPSINGAAPVLQSTVTAATNAVVNGIAISTAATGFVATSATGFTVTNTAVASTAAGISVTSSTPGGAGAAFTSVSSGGTATGISLTTAGGTWSFGSGALATSSGVGFNVSGGSPTATYDGTISASGGRAVQIFSMTGGSVTLGGFVTATGTSQGVALNANTTAVVTFRGGMSLTPSSSNFGFSSSGSGTVNVCDTALCGSGAAVVNTIATTNAFALSITNSIIGASGLRFRSISANGGANGIVLNTTGSSGGLTVTGDGGGAMNASGGLIQNTTGVGISITSARNVSLTQLNVASTGDHGLTISSVTNFTYQDASVINAGNGNDEQGFNILNVFGTSLIEDVRLDDITEDGIQVRQNATDDGTMDTLTIRRLTVEDHKAGFGESGIEAQPDLASQVRLIVDDCDFTLNTNAVIAAQGSTAASHTGVFVMTIQGSTFNAGNSFGSGGPQFLGGGSGTVYYTVDNNQILGTKFNGLTLNNDDTQTTHARVTNNTITGSGATNNGNGISMRQDANGTMFALVSGNNISLVSSHGIVLNGQDATVDDVPLELEATITGNTTVVNGGIPGGSPNQFGAGIIVESGVGVALFNDLCVDISGNNPSGTDTADFFDSDIVLNILDTNATMRVRQTSAAVSSANAGAHFTTFANPPAAIVFNGGLCTAPLSPPSLVAADGEAPATVMATPLKAGDVGPALLAARAQWRASGLKAEELRKLESIAIELTDLPGALLGEARGSSIGLDRTAAGWGWFVDPTPDDDDEFGKTHTPDVADRIDLLTVLVHEIGHVLGRPDVEAKLGSDDVMTGTLARGVRRAPIVTRTTKLLPTEAPRTPAFTLPAGRTATVILDAGIDVPFKASIGRVSAQATITGDAVSTVLSDDPSTGAPNDPTVTLVQCPGAACTASMTSGDFNGDGSADLVVYRPSNQTWYVRGQMYVQYGEPGDIPVPADYNGDGITDIAVYRPSTGRWLVRNQFILAFGDPGDLPIPADYDHDGAADLAVYRPSTGQWFVRNQFVVQFGDPTDIPIPADYNGDGTVDVAVYRPGTGYFYVRNQFATQYGGPGFVPVVADYDGNGTADIAVYLPATGFWFVRDQVFALHGAPGDVPMPRDFDGDGDADIAVYRPSTGHWLVRNQFDIGFGDPGDLPVPRGPQTGHALAGDFTGDRRTDVAVYRPSTGQWLVFGELTVQFGDATDVPVPADYTGDGRMDIAVYRPSTGQWFVRNLLATTFGPANATPVPGDYNGDGLADVAVFVSATGQWQVRNQFTVTFGQAGDIPAPGDYDGDGITDLAVYRPSTGEYLVRNHFTTVLGQAGDLPAPGDYNGDGILDAALYRPSTGEWIIRGQATVIFGLPTDIAIPGDYSRDGVTDIAVYRPSTGEWLAPGQTTLQFGAPGDVPIVRIGRPQ